jgi:hypothetical protein
MEDYADIMKIDEAVEMIIQCDLGSGRIDG